MPSFVGGFFDDDYAARVAEGVSALAPNTHKTERREYLPEGVWDLLQVLQGCSKCSPLPLQGCFFEVDPTAAFVVVLQVLTTRPRSLAMWVHAACSKDRLLRRCEV
jgi:hypothetical protein